MTQRVCRPSLAGARALGQLLRTYVASPVGHRVLRLVRPPKWPGTCDWQRGLCATFQHGICEWFGAYNLGTAYEVEDSSGVPLHQVVRVGPYYFDSEGEMSKEALLYRWGPDGEMGRLYGVTAAPRLRNSFYCSAEYARFIRNWNLDRRIRRTYRAERNLTTLTGAIHRHLDRKFGDPRQILCSSPPYSARVRKI